MGKLTLRSQFTLVFLLTLALSVVASALTWSASYMLFLSRNSSLLNPANYYEKQLPGIIKYIDEQGPLLLDVRSRPQLERIIPTAGITYQVLDLDAQVRYGSMTQSYLLDRSDLLKKLNTTTGDDHHFVKFYPILDAQKNLQGAVVLRYGLTLLAANPTRRNLTFLVIMTDLLAPFCYIALFTWLAGRRLGKRIERSIQVLIDGAKRIEQQDLDFSLEGAHGARELAQLATAFEEMRKALYDSLTREWRSEQERRSMVAAIAHDLRTPLTIIQGHVEGLLDGGSQHPKRLERHLHTIDQNIKRINQLIEEMHNVTEIDRPDFHLHPSSVDVPAFIDEKARDYDLLAQRKSITIALSIRDRRDHRRPARIDAGRLGQILDNIMANSIRFTPNAGRIDWDTQIEKDMLRMEICDTGPGFAENELLHVFKKFYQGDTSRFLEKGHTGLGLYIVKQLVEMHGGAVQAANRHGGGACISFSISFCLPESDDLFANVRKDIQGFIDSAAVIDPRRQRKTQSQRMQTDP